jgi:hypothetical protein
MKIFLKENWYKLMIGSSMMMASFGFMIKSVSPAYSNSEKDKKEIKNAGIPNSPLGTNGYVEGQYVYFVDGGYVYRMSRDVRGDYNLWKGNAKNIYGGLLWEKSKLP